MTAKCFCTSSEHIIHTWALSKARCSHVLFTVVMTALNCVGRTLEIFELSDKYICLQPQERLNRALFQKSHFIISGEILFNLLYTIGHTSTLRCSDSVS